jgi:hypothetical protein
MNLSRNSGRVSTAWSGEGAQDARGDGLETPGGFRVDGFDLPVDEKGDPDNGKERFVEPEHTGTPGAEDVTLPAGVPVPASLIRRLTTRNSE